MVFVFCYLLFVYVLLLPLKLCSFIMRDKKNIGLDGKKCAEKLGRTEGGETMFRIR